MFSLLSIEFNFFFFEESKPYQQVINICMRSIRPLLLDDHHSETCHLGTYQRLLRRLFLSVLFSIRTTSYWATCTHLRGLLQQRHPCHCKLWPPYSSCFHITTLSLYFVLWKFLYFSKSWHLLNKYSRTLLNWSPLKTWKQSHCNI